MECSFDFLSFTQKNIWIAQSKFPDTPLYNVGGYSCITGLLDSNLHSKAVNTLLNQADVFKLVDSAFCLEANNSTSNTPKYKVKCFDYSNQAEGEAECLRQISLDMQKKIDLGQLFLDSTLYKISEKKYIWFVKVHHIVFDGFSMALFFNSVAEIYSDLLNGRKKEYNRFNFVDHIQEERSYQFSDQYVKDKQFWLSKLTENADEKGFVSCMEKKLQQSFHSIRKELVISRTLFNSIELFCSQLGCTPFHYFISSILLLNKLYGNSDMPLGIPVYNRSNKKFKNTLGTFVNVFPFISSFEMNLSFHELLGHVKTELKEFYRHQKFSLLDLFDEVEASNQFYSVLFSYQKNVYNPKFGEADSAITYLHNGTQREDLRIHLLEHSEDGDLLLSFDYKPSAFKEDVFSQLILHLDTLLKSLHLDGNKVLSSIDYISSNERKQILEWSHSKFPFPKDHTLVSLFAEQVAKTPNNIAVAYNDVRLSYIELNEWSNRLAGYLRKAHGVKQGDLVGILLSKSEWLIVSILGVLKSGAAYLPIDPEYPKERIDYILKDSACKLTIDIDELVEFTNRASQFGIENSPVYSTPADLAYVIYTSGTTGLPKGVMIETGSIVNYILAQSREYAITDSDKILQLSNVAFDASVEQIFISLLNGATLCLPDKEVVQDVHLLDQFIDSNRITHVHAVPSLLQKISEREFPFLKRVISAGEICPPALAEFWCERVQFYNKYGPTETTISSTIFCCNKEHINSFNIPIGKPIANSSVYILDNRLQILPIGVYGEICIGGLGLARGYFNKPELTSEKFIEAPLFHERIYKTGDIGRWLSDGSIEFLGRKDEQVKIRGHRIELGEIENVLLQYPNLSSVSVVAKPDSLGEMNIVAYVVSNTELLSFEIRNFLSNKLPTYMLPSYYVQLEELPISSNGKIDKKKLIALKDISVLQGVEYVAPRNEIEKKLVSIWEEILDREMIGVYDDFFELGGHSLKVTRLLNRIQMAFNVRVELKDLFGNSQLEKQALLINNSIKKKYVSIPSISKQESYPLSSSQRRLWILCQFTEANKAYNMPGIFILDGELDADVLTQSFRLMLKRHEILRTVFRSNEEGEVRQFIIDENDFLFSVEQTNLVEPTGLTNGELSSIIQLEVKKTFDLSQGPLFRVHLYRVASQKYVLCCVLHHIISDGWSMNVLLNDLFTAYNSLSTKFDSALPSLNIQYKDYAKWQQDQLIQGAYSNDKAYWLKQFEGELPLLELSADKVRPAIKTYNGSVIKSFIDKELANKIKHFNKEQGSTLFMGLLAALNALLYKYTGQEDIIVGSPIAGREHADLDDQVGLYINTLAFRTRFNSKENFLQLLNKVKQTCIEGYEHQLYPFDELVDELHLQRDMSRSALFDIVLVLNNKEERSKFVTTKLGSVDVSFYNSEEIFCKFDIVFRINERADDLELELLFNTDLYSPDRMNVLSTHFVRLLSSALNNPTVPLCELAYLDASETQQLLLQSAGTAARYDENATIVSLFEERVKLYPERTALVFEESSLTYKGLNEQVNALADYLRTTYAIMPDELIGVKLERSEWMVIAILAILKSGAGYVPIDPAYPVERIAYMQSDSKCKVVIDLEMLNRFQKDFSNCSTTNPVAINKGSDLAYVIYTSGTTGQPKGTLIEHRNVVRLLFTDPALFDFNEKDVWTMFHSYCFDFSVWEMYGALLNGGKLVVISKEAARDPKLYLKLLQKEGVTVLNQTPSAFYNLQEEALKTNTAHQLRYVIFGGEALSPIKLKDWKRSYPASKLINMYGITETTVHVTYKEITEKEIESNISNIGVPIPTLSCYVLDTFQNLLPLGVEGELYVGGAGLARGYLNRAELTAEKFIDNPFEKGTKLYRSGDRVKRLANGEMEYFGRKDEQVKIRGHRVELGEIEQVLQSFAGIKAALVIAKGNKTEEKSIVAYIISDEEVSAGTLRVYLSSQLPAYMLPSYYVRLDNFPLTSNGKIDRKSLPDPLQSGLGTGVEYVAPRNETEAKLVVIWEEILGKKNIGIKDNMFESGGDSIMAIKIINKLQKEFKEIFQLATLFECPTPELFSNYIIENKKNLQSSVIDEEKLKIFRESITVSIDKTTNKKLKRAIFILSPPRSGSTLVRVIMGGHKELFSPPELELAGFSTMKDRSEILSGKFEFLKEGVTRAVMELMGCNAEEAKAILAEKEKNEESIFDIYNWLQEQIDGLVLVDKTPSYAYSLRTLESIEDLFENAFYIHLVRNPKSTILSYEEVKLDQIYRFKTPFNRREMAELEWLNCHDNILNFLDNISEDRQFHLKYEELVSNPEETVEKLCKQMGIGFEKSMLSVYDNNSKKMTDGLHKESKMIGDLKFLSHHKDIDKNSVQRWKKDGRDYVLGEPTIKIALKLGYENSDVVGPNLIELKPLRPAVNYELSSSQKRFWVLSQFKEGSVAYNMPGVFLIEGEFQLSLFEQAFQKLINRHEILRTQFKANELGDVKQFISDKNGFDFKVIPHDLSTSNNAEVELTEMLELDIKTPFDLSEGPLLRANVYKLGKNKWVFCYVMHHIIGDGWSMGVLINELIQFYDSSLKSESHELPPLRVQYKEYAAWQQEQLSSGMLNKHKQYWLDQFSGDVPVLLLPTDKTRPAIKTYNGGVVYASIKKETSTRLKQIGEEQGTTLFMNLLASLNVLLYRYTGQIDIVVGTPIAGREDLELENQIGLYLNTLALRTSFDGHVNYLQLLKEIKRITLGAFEHQLYPFDELVNDLKLQHDLSRSALFDVMLVLINTDVSLTKSGVNKLGLANVSPYGKAMQETSKFDLTFTFTSNSDSLQLSIQYNSDLYQLETIERMSIHLVNILDALVCSPVLPIMDIEYISITEKEELLRKDSARKVGKYDDETLVSLFEKQVQRVPNNCALTVNNVELTYAELNSRVNRLANYIRNNYSIGQSDFVGLLLERNEWMIVSILAILKCGATYVPMDIEYPEERIRYMLEDSNCKLLINSELLQKFESVANDYDSDNLSFVFQPCDLAYVIYTSGTTGNPKGVMIEHRNVTSLFKSSTVLFDFNESDVWSMFHSYCFDFSVWEMYGALLFGGKLVIVPTLTAKDPVAFHQLIMDQGVTVVNQTPSAFYNLQDVSLSEDRNLNLRFVIFGGEALSPGKLEKWHQRYPTTKLINMYGITETTVHVTFKEISTSDIIAKKSNIGLPIPSLSCYVFDTNNKLVPFGVEGELFVGGEGVARGYLNRPDLTTERFILNPYDINERLYKSGDNVKMLSNGDMEYIGRRDHQVKVRGYRIELGEIENALQSDSSVETAVVIAKQEASGENCLVAYLVSNVELNVIELRNRLVTMLPIYMLPDHFIQMDAIPLTSNGKIDRKRLPSPEQRSMATGMEYVAPSNAVEERLVELWKDVLGRDKIGVMDNFFELGGHSLKATKLLSKINKEFELTIELKDVFYSPTIEKLAKKIDFIRWNNESSELENSIDEIEIEL